MIVVRLGALALLGALLAAAPAHADAGTAAAPANAADAASDLDDAKKLRDLGAEAMSSKHWEEALQWFQRSYARFPSVRMRYNIAFALDNLGRGAAAVEQYESFLAANSDDKAQRAYAQKRIAALDSSVARLELDVSPPDANVWIDERPLARVSPSGVAVAPGTVRLAADEPGYLKVTLEVTLAPGERRHLTITLPPEPKPAPPPEPSAAATRPDGMLALTAPLPSPAKPPVYRRAWLWGAVGGGALVGVGAIVLGVTLGHHDHYPPPPTLGSLEGN